MTTVFQSDGKKGTLEYIPEDTSLAKVEFTLINEDKMIIDHIEVDDSLRGQGIGKKLLMEIVEYLREKEMKAIPACSYAQAVFKKDESIQDVLN